MTDTVAILCLLFSGTLFLAHALDAYRTMR